VRVLGQQKEEGEHLRFDGNRPPRPLQLERLGIEDAGTNRKQHDLAASSLLQEFIRPRSSTL
jgi:hypothetical protein